MANNNSHRLVEILIRLGADCWSRHGDRHWELHDKRHSLGRDAFDALDERSELKRGIVAVDTAIAVHPFTGFVRLVSIETGIDRSNLTAAARREFDGDQDYVGILNTLDVNGTTGRLIEKLHQKWPNEAASLFGSNVVAATGQSSSDTDLRSSIGSVADTLAVRILSPNPSDATADTETVDGPGEALSSMETGFLGGTYLADALGVLPTRRSAFLRRVNRLRVERKLGDDWCEVTNPRPNCPRYLYRVGSPKLHALAMAYKCQIPA
jgi:hypothetical protein